ncbi:hypothetical protein Psfp_04159 [Pelotomaculum sp. FP]|uniref:hypothetical protein n=1 Tax=Pelotomaculum sp. FP TaxID=261474 RepID=UPI001064DC84|nr:hypothetical protein [Pelotomaculum sp. FP]TEB10487.1 hypothetical protein Psfp_04159 [Pelotomaculum sp. FP]
MISLINEFLDDLKKGKYLIVMPISRFNIERNFSIGRFHFFPAEEVNLKELRIVPNKELNQQAELQVFKGQDLREVSSSITGISAVVFRENTLVSFTTSLDWNSFLLWTHQDDIRLISRLSQQAEEAMDILRFYFCRMDLPDTLPGPVGTWEDSNGFSGALVYSLQDNESYMIAGSIINHLIVKGIGLDLNNSQISFIDKHEFFNNIAEVGAVVRTGLNLYTGVLEANTNTSKFIRAMSLFDYLAYPNNFKKFEKVKKEIACHIAQTRQQYNNISNRFQELTGKKDETGSYTGFRTRIVHLGGTLEEILGDNEIIKLFLELNRYIGKVIQDMMDHSHYTWDEFTNYRDALKIDLGVKQR